ncbi:hypothetical protein [Citrobacter pasteurii]|nr:hypothetical protein [Citrobacter pasteurii]
MVMVILFSTFKRMNHRAVTSATLRSHLFLFIQAWAFMFS